jgi:hypothetical protein
MSLAMCSTFSFVVFICVAMQEQLFFVALRKQATFSFTGDFHRKNLDLVM